MVQQLLVLGRACRLEITRGNCLLRFLRIPGLGSAVLTGRDGSTDLDAPQDPTRRFLRNLAGRWLIQFALLVNGL